MGRAKKVLSWTAVVVSVGIAVLSLVVVPLVLRQPPVYFARATYGTVIDAETKQPIEGAVVVAKWEMSSAGIGSPGPAILLHIAEAVTDAKGRYRIPWWGPRLHWPLTWLDHHDPILSVLKSGYAVAVEFNEADSHAWIRESEWNGRPLELARFRGSRSDRDLQLYLLIGGSGGAAQWRGCWLCWDIRALCEEILREADTVGRERAVGLSNSCSGRYR